jgi:hypothetical protein
VLSVPDRQSNFDSDYFSLYSDNCSLLSQCWNKLVFENCGLWQVKHLVDYGTRFDIV